MPRCTGSGTSSRILSEARLAERIARVAGARHVPLLVIRVCELEHVAWRDGLAAARRLERRARDVLAGIATTRLRAGDLFGHERTSATFSIALTARPNDVPPLPQACRATLGRATDAFAKILPLELESGWTLLGDASPATLHAARRSALERGARERQRFEFFSTVAHEMRTPLTAIRGYLQTLLDDEPPQPETARRFLEIARDEALRLARLVDGMFAVSLLDLGYASESSGNVQSMLPETLRSALGALGPRIRRRGARIEMHSLPNISVAIAHDHLVQVFANVIGNALDHGREGVCVAISGARRAQLVEIAVDDDGPGVPADARDAIFALGYRARNLGTGLGLAVVRQLLERVGGSAHATDSPLGGVRIVIVLRASGH